MWLLAALVAHSPMAIWGTPQTSEVTHPGESLGDDDEPCVAGATNTRSHLGHVTGTGDDDDRMIDSGSGTPSIHSRDGTSNDKGRSATQTQSSLERGRGVFGIVMVRCREYFLGLVRRF